MIDEKKIEEAESLKVPKRLYIIDYQLTPCEKDGISDARLNSHPFRTTRGKLVEYLCLDSLWHKTNDVPEKDSSVLIQSKSDGDYYTASYIDSDFTPKEGAFRSKEVHYGDTITFSTKDITRWLYIDDLLKGGNNG